MQRGDGLRVRLASSILTSAVLLFSASEASAGAVIFNTGAEATATVALGVNDEGHLNVADPFGVSIPENSPFTGVRLIGLGDATSPGCLCEGWGVSGTVGGFQHSGYANVAVDGVVNLTLDSFVTDALPATGSLAISSVHLTSLPGLSVTQAYSPADVAPGVLFKNLVTITNATGSTITDLRYTRVMDWDVPPTEFSETLTTIGAAANPFLEMSHDDGFATANPLDPFADASAPLAACAVLLGDYTDCDGSDHGAYFRFNFGSLADGESREFTIFYGAATSEAAAMAAIVAEAIELVSLGQTFLDPAGGTPGTYVFGFADVGGPVIPEPATGLLLGTGLIALGVLRQPRQRS
jgi:type IV pilus assembly protein PilY1